MAEFSSLALILPLGPYRAGKNVDSIKLGLYRLILGATSRVIRKYGSYISFTKKNHLISLSKNN